MRKSYNIHDLFMIDFKAHNHSFNARNAPLLMEIVLKLWSLIIDDISGYYTNEDLIYKNVLKSILDVI